MIWHLLKSVPAACCPTWFMRTNVIECILAERCECRGRSVCSVLPVEPCRLRALMFAGLSKDKKSSLSHKPAASPEVGHAAQLHHTHSAKSAQCSRSGESHTHTHTHTHRWRRHSSPHPLCGFLSHFKDVHVLLILKYVIAVRTSPSPELKPALIKLIISCLCSSSQPESLRCKNKAEQSDIQSKIHNSHTAREEFTPPSVDPNH